MKKVSVKAVNLRVGDVIDGRRIREIIPFRKRSRAKFPEKGANVGVLVVTPNPGGYDLDTFKFAGNERVTVKRTKR